MGYDEVSKRATMRYLKAKKERVLIWVKTGERDKLKACAVRHGYKAVSRFVIDAINEKAKEEIIALPQEVYVNPLTMPEGFSDPETDSLTEGDPDQETVTVAEGEE